MSKPTYEEVVMCLLQLTTVADNSIPSDDLSNSQLYQAEIAIDQAWKLLHRVNEKFTKEPA